MRQRRLKDLDEKLKDLSPYLDGDGRQNKGMWRRVFARAKIDSDWNLSVMEYENVFTLDGMENELSEPGYELCLEIGCGKGKFISEKAKAEKDSMFIGIEGHESVIVRAAEKARDMNLWNLYLINGYVHDVREYFDEGELDAIYLNFSDPWPKAKHEKRRLTYRENLEAYMDVLTFGGRIEFKTDNDELFDFTIEEAEAMGYDITEMTRDLTESGLEAAEFRTEYEEKFIEKGIKIKYLRIEK